MSDSKFVYRFSLSLISANGSAILLPGPQLPDDLACRTAAPASAAVSAPLALEHGHGDCVFTNHDSGSNLLIIF